ncbi:LysR substrate-binding domain-containing protein [Nocardioides lentus]|uniref:LysR substrate-binding domain-containing protein n=1 Tax=Nocardioides lentus TaxID=338077 RepID=A0ABN2PSM9_9ACTN
MDLRQLRYLTAVVHERSFTRAAAHLHMTQPPLSAAIAQLERELGVSLLERHGRGVEPTAAGEHLVARAALLLADLDATAASVRAVGTGLLGRLSVAIGPGLSSELLPHLLESFDALAPDVDVEVLDVAEPDAVDLVRDRACEVAVVYCSRAADLERFHGRELEVAMVRREPVVALVPGADDPRTSSLGDTATLPQLAAAPGLRWLAPVPHVGFPGLAERLREAWAASGGPPVVRRRLSGTDTAVRLVAAGGGFALVPSSVARAAAGPAHGTRVVALATPVAPVEAVVAWRQGERPSPVLTRFLRAALSTPEPDRLGPAHERETEPGVLRRSDAAW